MSVLVQKEIGTLNVNSDTGEGQIILNEGWWEYPAIFQLDTLNDMIGELTELYNEIHKIEYPEGES